MKKLLVLLSLMFVCVASATTVNLNWMVDNADYTQTTCETGGDLILPAAPPAKYGYTFRGWNLVEEIIGGTVTQNGTPSPSNPIYPTFYENNGMILRAIGNVADRYHSDTRKIIRRIGLKVLDGTEDWENLTGYMNINKTNLGTSSAVSPVNSSNIICSHFETKYDTFSDGIGIGYSYVNFNYDSLFTTLEQWKSWLADQYANGTPVTVYYLLAEPVEEVWAGQ